MKYLNMPNRRKNAGRVLATILVFFAAASANAANDPPAAPAPTTPPVVGTKEYYEAQKAKYEAEKAAYDAQAQALAAKLPSDSTIKPLEGKVTYRGGDINALGRWQEYRATDLLARKIAEQVSAMVTAPNVVLVTSRTDLPAALAEQNWSREILNDFEQDAIKFKAQIPKVQPEVPLPLVADAAIRAAATLVGFFKSDFELLGEDLKPDDKALIASLNGELKKVAVDVRAQRISASPDGSGLVKRMAAVREAIGEANVALAQQSSAKDQSEFQKKEIARRKESLAQMTAAMSKWAERPQDGKPSLLERILLTESEVSLEITHVLQAAVVNGGNLSATQRFLWGSPTIFYVGTVSAAYTLTEAKTGKVLAANTSMCALPMKIALKRVGVANKEGKPVQPLEQKVGLAQCD